MFDFVKKFLMNIFSISDADYSHKLVRIFGIKIRILKPEIEKNMTLDYSGYNDITEIPKAEGFLREYQLALLAILKEMDRVCKLHNIPYWLSGGTLLGAKRHKGFIPWDDDIDTDMMRDDYEKFVETFNSSTSNPDLYCTIWRDENASATCILKIKHKKIEQAFIDVFPHDYYPEDVQGDEKIKLNKKIKFIRKLLRINPFRISDTTKLKKFMADITHNIINKKRIPDKNTHPSIHWGIDFPHKHPMWIYDYDQIFPLKTLNFEGYDLPVPNDTEFMLHNLYRDYMTFPKSICPHHTDESAFTQDERIELKKLVETLKSYQN